MTWRVVGDFTRVLDYSNFGSSLTRDQRFVNETQNSIISQIRFARYRTDSYVIFVSATNIAAYDILLAEIESRNLPSNDMNPSIDILYTGHWRCEIQLNYAGDIVPPLATPLFQLIQAVEPSFEEIREQINNMLGIHLSYAEISSLPASPSVPSPQQIQERIRFIEEETHARGVIHAQAAHEYNSILHQRNIDQERRRLAEEETPARNILQARADHAYNDIIRARNIAERRFYPADDENANTCGICLINPAAAVCDEYSITRSTQMTIRTRMYVCNNCTPNLQTQRLTNGMCKFQNWRPYPDPNIS